MRCSIRTRLTLWYSAVMVVALTAFSVGVLWLHARWGRAQFDSELASLGAAMSRVMQEELSESGNLQKAVSETRTSMDVPGRATAILDLQRQADVRAVAWLPVRLDDAAPADTLRSRASRR